jgi:hypothetical protein
MMYSKNFVVAVKHNGKVLREEGDIVKVPFGAEYTVLLKNLNSVRAKVTVSIDGTSAIESLVLQPNQSIDLERYLNKHELG